MPFDPALKTLVIAIPIRFGAFYARVVQAFERYAGAYGYRIVSTTIGHTGTENAGPDFKAILQWPISRIILVDLPDAFRAAIEPLCSPGAPIVSVGVFTIPTLDSVNVNYTTGVTQALEFLISECPGRIAFFGPGITDEISTLDTFAPDAGIEVRVATYHELMTRHKRKIEIIPGNPGSRRESTQVFMQHIDEYGCPDAIFCFNDDLAIAALRALHELEIDVPDGVMLMGCDGLDDTLYVTPTLSSVEQPFTQMVARALELLERRIENPNRPIENVIVDAQFVQRESTSRENLLECVETLAA